ncbi:SDR family NAD(P)-dependent oxidoreductase [Candidatus Poriferisodalis sp.]|uniref:SDR family NAD(P)-dependent oxidoreductase n=1 Tax=Candidatus Poriferisodalis sp. TaxID=3101277 RepID=UPI003B019A69
MSGEPAAARGGTDAGAQAAGIARRFRMDGRVAVVTGAGQGIGRSIAVALAEHGCDVVVNARRIGDLEATAAAIGAHGRRAHIVQGDIRDFSATLADRSVAAFDKIDVWVNNVGGSDEKTVRALADTPDDVFRSQLELNLTTAFQGCKAAAAAMGRAGGAIVNISSGAGTRGSPMTGPYAAAKAAMNNLTQTLALELAPRIRVNAVAPGPIATEAFHQVLGVSDRLDELTASIPLGRMGEPEDVAAAVVYLASDAAAWVTGQLLAVSGGRTQRTTAYRPAPPAT